MHGPLVFGGGGGGGGGLSVVQPYIYDGTNYYTSQPPLKQVTRPVPGNFSWISTQGTKATATATNSAIILQTAESAFGMRMYGVTIPATPYTVVADMAVNIKGASQDWCGLALKGTGTTFITFGPAYSSGYILNVSTWSQTAFLSNLFASDAGEYSASPFISLKIADDGTNRTYAYSVNGLIYTQVLTETHTANIVPTSIGIFVNDQTAVTIPIEVCLLGWTVT